MKRIVSAIMEAGFDLQAVPAVFHWEQDFERNVSPGPPVSAITLPDPYV